MVFNPDIDNPELRFVPKPSCAVSHCSVEMHDYIVIVCAENRFSLSVIHFHETSSTELLQLFQS